MISPIHEARKMFLSNSVNPRCLVVISGTAVVTETIMARFDHEGWSVTWLDAREVVDRSIFATLQAIVDSVDLVYLVMQEPNTTMIDVGYVFGMAKVMHKPVFLDFRGDPDEVDFPAAFLVADGIGQGHDDLSLFLETFSYQTELSDPCTRARSVASKIRRLRLI